SGFTMMTWEQHREQLAKEYVHPPVLAKDLPHELEDRINFLSSYAQHADNMQVKLFEAAIAENTESDEPHTPPIHIINDIDDDLTPPYEFHYSNLMWHGEGVPKPDWENLRGCDCIGPCDPKSETCICAQRHQQHSESPGFLYDQRLRLRSQGYPIFECNDLCRCSDDCINRVVPWGRKHPINICKTENKGWGVFAGHKKIPANTYIGIYAGEYLTESEAEERGVLYNKFGRTYLFNINFWHLHVDDPNWTIKYSINAYHAGN
ncbi:SET domain-containing protein, partial [Laetiporus sulphureus 93-53]